MLISISNGHAGSCLLLVKVKHNCIIDMLLSNKSWCLLSSFVIQDDYATSSIYKTKQNRLLELIILTLAVFSRNIYSLSANLSFLLIDELIFYSKLDGF